MKKIYKSIICILSVAIVIGCAKTISESDNTANKRYLDAWMSVNHSGVKAQWNDSENEYGIFVIDSEGGTGSTVKKDGYAFVEFIATDLEGNISSYTNKEIAKQLGVYDTTTYYGPQVWLTTDETIQAGLQNALVGMNVGGSKTTVIPSWLMSYSKYSSAKDYFKKKSDYSNTIYHIKVTDYTDDINKWQIEKMKGYMEEYYGGVEAFKEDTTGFYFKSFSTQNGKEEEFPSDTTIYINYTGKLLNGLIFDTNIERVALDNGLYNSSASYEPVKITWGDNYSEITMGSDGSSVIPGFAMTLWNLRNKNEEGKFDKGVGIFYSPLGYGYSGSGASIPPYAPLVFEIDIVAEPED